MVCFVLFDDAQYMRYGLISRNWILKLSDGWQYIMASLKKMQYRNPYKNIQDHPDKEWRRLIVRQLARLENKS